MKTLYLFRSNLKSLEYYHKYNNVDDFEKYCHDFYLLMPFEFLKMGIFDNVYIFRLTNKKRNTITFKVKNEKNTKGLFHQIFCTNFNEVFHLNDKPDISIFRGGFKEYDNVIRQNKSFFGKSFYLGASRRFHPQYGGIYDYILYESEKDLLDNKRKEFQYKKFFKTANPKIFYPKDIKKEFDIIWPWKYTSDFRKGEIFFLKGLSNHKKMQQLKIYHCGNEPDKAKKLFQKFGINNIICDDNIHYHKMVDIINLGYCGLITSDKEDGCPRLSTEIISCATPLLIRNKTRILNFYKTNNNGVFEYSDINNLYKYFYHIKMNYEKIRNDMKDKIKKELSLRNICKMNLKEWDLI